MAKIKTQNGGKVILQDNKVSCECCDLDIGDFVFGSPEDCDCENVQCYNADSNPSPATITVGGTTYNNRDPNTDHVVINTATLQGPIHQNNDVNLPVVDWQNYFTTPSVVRLFGQLGGDIAIEQLLGPGSSAQASANGITFPSDWNSVYRMADFIPQNGEYPCGECDTPRNGPHNLDLYFVLWPFTVFRIRPWTYLECAPFYNLRLRRVSLFTPP